MSRSRPSLLAAATFSILAGCAGPGASQSPASAEVLRSRKLIEGTAKHRIESSLVPIAERIMRKQLIDIARCVGLPPEIADHMTFDPSSGSLTRVLLVPDKRQFCFDLFFSDSPDPRIQCGFGILQTRSGFIEVLVGCGPKSSPPPPPPPQPKPREERHRETIEDRSVRAAIERLIGRSTA